MIEKRSFKTFCTRPRGILKVSAALSICVGLSLVVGMTACQDSSSDNAQNHSNGVQQTEGIRHGEGADLNFTRLLYIPYTKMQVARGRKVNVTYSFEDDSQKLNSGVYTLNAQKEYANYNANAEQPVFQGGSFIGIEPAKIRANVVDALKQISAVAPICLIEVRDPRIRPDIKFRKSTRNMGLVYGDVSNDKLLVNTLAVSLGTPAVLHNFMLLLGIELSNDRSGVMYSLFNPNSGLSKLAASDIKALQDEFGAGSCETTVTTPENPYDFLKPIVIDRTATTAVIQWSGAYARAGENFTLPPSYKIELAKPNEDFKEFKTVPAEGNLTTTLTGLSPNTQYRLRMSTVMKYPHSSVMDCFRSFSVTEKIPNLAMCGIVTNGDKKTFYKNNVPGVSYDVYKRVDYDSKPIKIATLSDSQATLDVTGTAQTTFLGQALSEPFTFSSKPVTFSTPASDPQSWKPIVKDKYLDPSHMALLEKGDKKFVISAVNTLDDAKLFVGAAEGSLDLSSVPEDVYEKENIMGLLVSQSKDFGAIAIVASNTDSKCFLRFYQVDASSHLKQILETSRDKTCGAPKLDLINAKKVLSWIETGSPSVNWIWDVGNLDFKSPPVISTYMTSFYEDKPVAIYSHTFTYQDEAYFITLSEKTSQGKYRLVRIGFKVPEEKLGITSTSLLATNLDSPYFLSSQNDQNGKNTTLFQTAGINSRLGVVRINWLYKNAKPTILFTYQHDVGEISVPSSFADLSADGQIMTALPGKIQTFSDQGVAKSTFTVPDSIKSLHDWMLVGDSLYIVGPSSAGKLSMCQLKDKVSAKCINLPSLAASDEVLGRARLLVDSKNSFFAAVTVNRAAKPILVNIKGVIP